MLIHPDNQMKYSAISMKKKCDRRRSFTNKSTRGRLIDMKVEHKKVLR